MCSRLKGVPLKAVLLWTSLIAWSLSKEQMNALHMSGWFIIQQVWRYLTQMLPYGPFMFIYFTLKPDFNQ